MHARRPAGDGVDLPDYVEQELLSVNEWSRPGTELRSIGGADGPTEILVTAG